MKESKQTGATALPNPDLVDQLCDAVLSRLEEHLDGNCLPITRRAGFHGLARGRMRIRPEGVKRSLPSGSATGSARGYPSSRFRVRVPAGRPPLWVPVGWPMLDGGSWGISWEWQAFGCRGRSLPGGSGRGRHGRCMRVGGTHQVAAAVP